MTYHFEFSLTPTFKSRYKLSNISITISLLNYYGLYHSETISATIFFPMVFNHSNRKVPNTVD